MAIEKHFFVYILANRPHGTIYVGVTSDLVKRAYQHKTHCVDGFTKRYNVDTLVYFEEHATAEAAITREKRLKRWRREWKDELIEANNAQWRDLYDDIASS